MRRTLQNLAVVSLLLIISNFVFAGFTDFDCAFPDDPQQIAHSWVFTGLDSQGTEVGKIEDGDPSGDISQADQWTLALGESLTSTDYDQVTMSGSTDVDPDFTIVKTIDNNSGVTWTAYQLILSGNATFVDNTAGSTKFGSVQYSEDFKTVTFLSPNEVLDGQSVTLQVDINVPTTGLFNFTMTQNPIPEPATIVLLCFGTAGVFMTKRG